MSQHILLPGLDPAHVPEGLDAHRMAWGGDGPAAVEAFRASLLALAGGSMRILGGEGTPALAWAIALRSLPDAEAIWFRSDRSGWWSLDGQDVTLDMAPVPEPAITEPELAEPEPVAPSEPVAAPEAAPLPASTAGQDAGQEPEALRAPSATPSPAAEVPTPEAAAPEGLGVEGRPAGPMGMTYGELVRMAFLWAAWGDHDRALENLRDEARRRATDDGERNLPDNVGKAERNGRIAHDLARTLEEKVSKGESDQAILAWIKEASKGHHATVAEHLKNKLKKERARQKDVKARHQGAQGYQSSLRPVVLKDGQHPNSLAHLAWADEWQILIDETGTVFDAQAEAMSAHDKNIGRLVALVVPAGVVLQPLNQKFHATTASVAEVDQIVQALLDRRVGIFGYSVTDPAVDVHQWIGHIHQLVRWVILQLPVRSDMACVVNVLIEQKGAWNKRSDLGALAEVLEGEFQRLDGERFAGLRIKLTIMDKSHELNGYVDSIAYTWGSQAAQARDRLKKTGWLDTCLLRPGEKAMQRLYLALNAQHKLPAQDWYELCAAATQGGQDMLARHLDKLGEHVAREQPGVWQSYLDDVRYRLHAKHFTLDAITRALDWLDRWAPQDRALPDVQRLMLESARLAADSHGGHVDVKRFEQCLALVKSVHDEAPAEACEAVLRMASGAANRFQFDLLRPMVERWLNEPVAVPGLLNHAKLHSTLGQMLAFGGQTAEALAAFERALQQFEKLSDLRQAERESAQTTAYRLIAMMGDPAQSPDEVQRALLGYFSMIMHKSDLAAISNSLAHSGHERRFAQHLWLRALATYPDALAEGRAAYLKQGGQWQSGEGHPWPLIEAYRAWLLWDEGRPNDARAHMHAAIDDLASAESGPVLRWMAEVLRTFAHALGMSMTDDAAPGADEREALRAMLPYAPHDALERFAGAGRLDRLELLAHLRNALPFNFH